MTIISIKRIFLIILIFFINQTNQSELNNNNAIIRDNIKIELTNNVSSDLLNFQTKTNNFSPQNLNSNLNISENKNFSNTNNSINDNNSGVIISNRNDIHKKVTSAKNDIFNGIYKNYKSTYLGNKTSSEYRKLLNRNLTKVLKNSTTKSLQKTTIESDNLITIATTTEIPILSNTSSTILKLQKIKKKKNIKPTENNNQSDENDHKYNIGPGVDINLDMEKNLVNVDLDENCLRDILFSDWDDDSDEGRGKKYDLMSKLLPLFILPFLIQSSIIPFFVTTLKLLLIKSIVVGKLAIFLLIISAIKNNQKPTTYEPYPSYWASPSDPMRRSEASYNNGYKFEGKPAGWNS